MRSSASIKDEIRITRQKLEELRRELDAAERSECRVSVRVGDRITCNGYEFEVSDVKPWGTENAAIHGRKIKKDGMPSAKSQYVCSADSLSRS